MKALGNCHSGKHVLLLFGVEMSARGKPEKPLKAAWGWRCWGSPPEASKEVRVGAAARGPPRIKYATAQRTGGEMGPLRPGRVM